jgi:hypothetical protein
MKRDLKDWSITKELALDRREWKLAIHVPESLSSVPSLLLSFVGFFLFIHPIFPFCALVFYCLFLFVFLSPFVFPLLFHSYFVSVFRLLWVSSLAYPTLLRTKRFGCCCCITIVVLM